MPSPFPGMDPYLEAPEIWPDLHEALAGEIRRQLNLALPRPYYARLEMRPDLDAFLAQILPAPDYFVLVNRGWQRAAEGEYQVFPFTVRDWLPCIPIPLREGGSELVLDLQFVFNQSYDAGPYLRGAVDYSASPDPPLRPEDVTWAQGLLRAAGLVAS